MKVNAGERVKASGPVREHIPANLRISKGTVIRVRSAAPQPGLMEDDRSVTLFVFFVRLPPIKLLVLYNCQYCTKKLCFSSIALHNLLKQSSP
jgi:hypothetical protein